MKKRRPQTKVIRRVMEWLEQETPFSVYGPYLTDQGKVASYKNYSSKEVEDMIWLAQNINKLDEV